MAAFDIPWLSYMPSDPPPHAREPLEPGPSSSRDPNPPTFAPFAPPTPSASRSGYQVAQKSPLLVATPPQITRALSQSHPYVRIGNKVMGLLTWTSGDSWESFLLVAAFWAVVLYGEVLVRYGGNVLVVLALVMGVFLSKFKKNDIHPSLDEILETLQTFTARLNIFFDPFYSVTTFLSVGRTPTTTTTVPALTSLALRTLAVTPLWLLLAVWPLHIITGRRVIITTGTLILSWHSRPAKVTRTILWRSLSIRWACEQLTGLTFTPTPVVPPPLPPRKNGGTPFATPNASTTSLPATVSSTASAVTTAAAKAATYKSTPLEPGKVSSPGVRFTFVIYENQRRWLGIGWNTSLFAYERAPWTDETLEPCPPPAEFSLPHTPRGSGVKWRWVSGEDWRVDGQDMEGRKPGKKQAVKDKLGGSGVEGEGWIYYDNKWNHGTREGGDSWGKYTRRRKWVRNAELVEDHTDEYPNAPSDQLPIPPPPVYTETPDTLELEGSAVPATKVTALGTGKAKEREVLEEDEQWHD